MRRILLSVLFSLPLAGPVMAQEAVLTPVEDPDDGGVPEELLVSGGGHATEFRALASTAEAHRLCEAYIEGMVAGRFKEAFSEIRPYFPVPDRVVGQLREQTQEKLRVAERQFGASLGFAFVSAEALQGSILQFRFLQYFEWDVLYWEFIFYKSGEGWVLNALGFDDKLSVLFD